MDIEKLENGGYKATGDFVQELYNHMTQGNPKCKYAIGDVIKKVSFDNGDQTEIGTKGLVIGNAITGDDEEFYLVEFEDREHPTFITKDKIGLLSDETV
jgi:hypothetical protein